MLPLSTALRIERESGILAGWREAIHMPGGHFSWVRTSENPQNANFAFTAFSEVHPSSGKARQTPPVDRGPKRGSPTVPRSVRYQQFSGDEPPTGVQHEESPDEEHGARDQAADRGS